MPRKPNGAESVRDLIADTAAKLFVLHGVHSVSLHDIATEAHLSKGTLYYHYPTKEALILEIARRNVAAITDAMFLWVDTLVRGTVAREAFDILLDILLRDKPLLILHMVLCTEAALGEPALKDMLNACYKEWSIMLEVGSLKIQSRRSASARINAKHFFMLFSGYLAHSSGGILDVDKNDFLDFILI